ncbi:hypothetical protein ARMGADRAFT_783367 [Armillaria gallica]|uniref:Uncharacterized protein n=1 Tax=Armillaria gallica TaxID=47427 RepID=A0A2H3D173_ARMGA|nr:hypothetical protein ARMGADRAFT_783367 [Armillaria gallica]
MIGFEITGGTRRLYGVAPSFSDLVYCGFISSCALSLCGSVVLQMYELFLGRGGVDRAYSHNFFHSCSHQCVVLDCFASMASTFSRTQALESSRHHMRDRVK